MPPEPSRYGNSDQEEEDDNHIEVEHPEEADEQERQPSERFGLRNIPRVQYSAAVKSNQFDIENPKLSHAIASDDRDHWIKAMNDEFDLIIDNDTWIDDQTSKPPPGTKILPSGVILRVKRDENGDVSRFKARVVVRGNFQNEFDDYAELYAPVACIELVRVIVTVAVHYGYSINHLDVKGAFLHALLPESDDIWVRLTKIDDIRQINGQVVKLKKSLYGLRQAPKLWYKHLATTLKKIGFRRSSYCKCLFIGGTKAKPVYIVSYVDDLLVLGPDDSLAKTKTGMSKILSVTDLGACKHFLGINIDYRQDGLLLSQSAYNKRVLATANMLDCKPVGTPLPFCHTLYRDRVPATEKVRRELALVPYRNLLGSVIYLSTRTRPDISTAISLLGKFQTDPTPSDWKALKHLLRYLKGPVDFGIFIPRQALVKGIDAYSDADWARDETSRRSRTGIVIMYHGTPVIWSSSLQQTTATSTAEAEFSALATCAKEIVWLRDILPELSIGEADSTIMH